MGRAKRKIIENLEITDIVQEGKGLGRKNDFVVFVKNTIPGDVVDAVVIKNKTNFKEAQPVKFHKFSDYRISPQCKHFDLCGGCKWQNISYENQLKFKQKIVLDAFERIAKVKIDKIFDILPSPNNFFYRNKLEFTFSSRRWLTKDEINTRNNLNANGLGFHLPGMFDRIIDIDECLLQSDLSNKIRNNVKKFAIEQGLNFYDTRNHTGFLRNLIIRNSFATDEYMVILIVGEKNNPDTFKILDFIKQNFEQVKSLYYIENIKTNDNYADLEAVHYFGKEVIEEKIGDFWFQIGPKSFFQTNPVQAGNLYAKALEFAELKGTENVLDLYTGTGTIALFISQKAKKIVGIETIAEAVEDARKNAKLNNIGNAEFITGQVEDILTVKFIKTYGKPEVVFMDPPRAGVHKNAIATLLKAKPQKIIYISCNPATQARDIAMLSSEYSVEKIQSVDMFPQTFHVENIALLKIIEN